MTLSRAGPIVATVTGQHSEERAALEIFRDSFALADEAQAICRRLIAEKPHFQHLVDARIVCIASQMTVRLHGAEAYAVIGPLPRVQGPMAQCLRWLLDGFVRPVAGEDGADFLVLIDAARWSGLDDIRRERLMFHELKHLVAVEDENGIPKLDDDGRVRLKTVPHDYEFFDDELREYGPVVCDLDALPGAIVAGFEVERRRHRKGLKRAG